MGTHPSNSIKHSLKKMSIVRRGNIFDPFTADLFEGLFPFSSNVVSLPRSNLDGEASAFAGARIDWKETPEAHVFKADLPGIKKEEVKVEVEDGRVLHITGERSLEKEEKTDTWHRVERSSGKFSRRFRLPENAKVEQVKAAMENGALTVTIPKEEVKKPEVEPKHAEILGHLLYASKVVAEKEGIGNGFRVVINNGPEAWSEVKPRSTVFEELDSMADSTSNAVKRLFNLTDCCAINLQVKHKGEAAFRYVMDVLNKSCSNGEDPIETWPSLSNKPVNHYERGIANDDSEEMTVDHKLLFDLISDVLLDLYENCSSHSVGLSGFAMNDGWMSLQPDAECVVIEMEGLILDDLLDEFLYGDWLIVYLFRIFICNFPVTFIFFVHGIEICTDG